MPAHNVIRFLVVDADEVARNTIRHAVTENGDGEVVEARNMSEAIAALSTGTIDMVICGWAADTGPELGLVKLVKQQEAYRRIPFLMTAFWQAGQDERVRRAAAAGVDGYHLKPLELTKLRAAISDVLSRCPGF